MRMPTTLARRSLIRVAMATSAGLLAACTSMTPPHATPPLPVANAYPSTIGDEVANAANAADVAWQEYFDSPDMRALIGQALANNRDLRTAVLRVEELRAAYAIQRSEAYPAVVGQGSGERSRTPGQLSLTGAPVTSNLFQVGVGMTSWEIDFWGAVGARREAALETFLASDSSRRAITIDLVSRVADAWLTLRELDERIALARETIATRQESLRIYSRRVELGATSPLNLTQVQTLLTQAQLLATQLELARAAQVNALTLLVGATPVIAQRDTASAEPDMGVAVPAMRELRTDLPSSLLVYRPDIVAAEHQLRAANANIGAARAAFFPRVTLTSSLGTASTDLDDLFGSGSQVWSFSPSISVPIFDGGRLRASLDVTEVRRELAVVAYEKAVQNAFRDVADALSARHWLREQLAIATTAAQVQTERARLSQLAFDSGSASFLEVLDAQRELLAARQQVVQSRRALHANQVSLYAALGGGSLTMAPAGTPAPGRASASASGIPTATGFGAAPTLKDK